ncbi:hypothetical protein L249_3090 [Ophiocordyceps polyrhachis-furcata BCC 54312]|uniref:Uncharacterized protein n=1 Tax=Ophiocordyceps polyrhachis-furcata BCC 54312 TaxID=1330021 RepID=A0A367LRI2_9HYPO|nr:hypothetical protein L249_3090 [Ophiocordyceps polyrhachis-furcata BCC 54312]
MSFFFHQMPLLLLLLLLPSVPVLGSNDDGIHRIGKQAQTTRPARLHARDDGNTCGVGMKLCPKSLGGRCCPSNYECELDSCYATTKSPSTCGSKVGWYACAAVYGGGCCPDGYLCQRAANCVPPSGSPYTYGCPASYYLCPSSMSYGCCPNGLACAVGQCYSTVPTTTRTSRLMTVIDGQTSEMTTTMTVWPEAPTGFPPAAGGDQSVLKLYPTALTQVSPPEAVDQGEHVTKAQLAGLVAGSMSLMGLVLLGGYVLLRHLGKTRSNDKAESPTMWKHSYDTDGMDPPPPFCSELSSPDDDDDGPNKATGHGAPSAYTVSPLSRQQTAWPSDVSELSARSVPAELSASSPSSTFSSWSNRWMDGWTATRRLDKVDEETYG